MATAAEDVEYESDPEESNRSLALRRRRAASDDEGDDGVGEGNEKLKADRRAPIHSDDDESDDQGGAAGYDDDEDELLDDEEEEIDDDEEEAEHEGYAERGQGGEAVMVLKELEGGEGVEGRAVDENGEKEGGRDEGEEKKENEPFAVPTAGAFYMHDDRFRDSAGGGRGRYDS